MRQFEARANQIETLKRQIEDMTAKRDSLGRQIKTLMEKFEPRLDDLISRINDAFSDNFEKISCAGEVGIHKDEDDFEQWAIKILVKFR